MRLLHLIFDLNLPESKLEGFRAAVARAAGFEQDLFHNHRADGSVQYRYPLVQYRSKDGKASITGLDAGAEAIYEWYQKADSRLFWNGREHQINIDRLEINEYALQYQEPPGQYRLNKWVALNQRHYPNWQSLPDHKARITELDRLLVAHILTFCRAVNWRLPERLEAGTLRIEDDSFFRLKGNGLLTFDLVFQSNLVLPPFIGLGKGVGHGFGECMPFK